MLVVVDLVEVMFVDFVMLVIMDYGNDGDGGSVIDNCVD